MQKARWLLPFTFGMDMVAIDSAVRLTQSAGAILVSASFVPASLAEVRLEHIQQSKDFLEAVRYTAERCQVPVERYEIFASDVLQSMTTLVQDTQCERIILVAHNKRTSLLQEDEVKQVLSEPPAALILMCLSQPVESTPSPHIAARFLVWLRRLWDVQDVTAVDGAEPRCIRTREHSLR